MSVTSSQSAMYPAMVNTNVPQTSAVVSAANSSIAVSTHSLAPTSTTTPVNPFLSSSLGKKNNDTTAILNSKHNPGVNFAALHKQKLEQQQRQPSNQLRLESQGQPGQVPPRYDISTTATTTTATNYNNNNNTSNKIADDGSGNSSSWSLQSVGGLLKGISTNALKSMVEDGDGSPTAVNSNPNMNANVNNTAFMKPDGSGQSIPPFDSANNQGRMPYPGMDSATHISSIPNSSTIGLTLSRQSSLSSTDQWSQQQSTGSESQSQSQLQLQPQFFGYGQGNPGAITDGSTPGSASLGSASGSGWDISTPIGSTPHGWPGSSYGNQTQNQGSGNMNLPVGAGQASSQDSKTQVNTIPPPVPPSGTSSSIATQPQNNVIDKGQSSKSRNVNAEIFFGEENQSDTLSNSNIPSQSKTDHSSTVNYEAKELFQPVSQPLSQPPTQMQKQNEPEIKDEDVGRPLERASSSNSLSNANAVNGGKASGSEGANGAGVFSYARKSIMGFLYPDATDVNDNLGSSINQQAYYCEKRKQWVFPDEDGADGKSALGPPPTGPVVTPTMDSSSSSSTGPVDDKIGTSTGASTSLPPNGPAPGINPFAAAAATGNNSNQTTADTSMDPLAALIAPPPSRMTSYSSGSLNNLAPSLTPTPESVMGNGSRDINTNITNNASTNNQVSSNTSNLPPNDSFVNNFQINTNPPVGNNSNSSKPPTPLYNVWKPSPTNSSGNNHRHGNANGSDGASKNGGSSVSEMETVPLD